jgi:DNA-binding beta-propeller fold protein YncE
VVPTTEEESPMIEARCRRIGGAAPLATMCLVLFGCGAGSEADTAAEDVPVAVEAATAAQPVGLPDPYFMMPDWGTVPPGREEWGRVSGVGVDPDGEHIWVAERCGFDVCIGSDVPVVLEYAPDGTLVKSFGGGVFMRPHGLHVDADGNIWVTDVRSPSEEELAAHPGEAQKGHQVVKFSPNGDILMVLGTPGEAGDPQDGRLNQPNDVVTAPNGDIYVSEGHSGRGPVGRISRFTADGRFVESFGEVGEDLGQFRVPHALAIDHQNHLFVADRSNNRVQVFELDGTLVAAWHQFGRPSDVFVSDDERLFTVDYESGEEDTNPGYRRGVYIGEAETGRLTAFVPGHEVESTPLGMAGEGIVMTSDGTLYVGEVTLRGMTKYVPR